MFFVMWWCNVVISQEIQSLVEFYVDTTKVQVIVRFDTTRRVYFLDDKRVSIKDIIKGQMTDTIEWRSATSSIRQILLNYGEKYRSFDRIDLYVTRKRDEEDN